MNREKNRKREREEHAWRKERKEEKVHIADE